MFFLIFSVQVLITSFEPSIADVESLALRESSEIRIASEELESAKAEYKAALLSFVPSIKTTAYVPSISYYSDEIYYPSYPYPIDYWKRKEEKLIITELSLSLPFGGDATVSYDLMKVGEFYNLYEDREYYEGNITFNLSQPIFGTSVLWDRIKQLRRGVGKKARELKKVKRDVKREVRRDIVSIFISEKTLEGINEMGELAERGLQELDFLRKKGVIDENEHLISKGKLGRFLLKKMEIEEDLRENKERLKLLTGLSDFSAAEIPIPDFSGESVPDIVFDLLTIRDDIMSIDDEISRKKRLFYPSFEVSGYLGLRGKDGEMESVMNLSRNRWGASIGLTIPILNPPSFSEFSSLKHRKKALVEREKSIESELELEKKSLLYKKEKLLKSVDIAKGIYKAQERSLKEIPSNLLSPSEKLELLEDYIHVMESYRSVLSEILTLDVSFEKEEE